MNDPHVVALFYNVKHSASVVYREEEPLEHEEKDFTIKIENDKACFTFTMEEPYATEEEARKAVEEYIQIWEIHAGLKRGPDMFKLVYWKPKIEYRNVESGHHRIDAGRISVGVTLSQPTITLTTSYPSPPQSGMKITPDVQSMYDRWAGYRLGKELLPSMAYFCLTVLEASTRVRKGCRGAVVKKYRIARPVLDKIGYLSSEKGGTQARKAKGIGCPLKDPEDCFLKEAIKALIHRAAEVAYGPVSRLPEIKLNELPKLPKS